ncbi:MAG: M28 family peptidase [Isosphaeraceae bacterium]
MSIIEGSGRIAPPEVTPGTEDDLCSPGLARGHIERLHYPRRSGTAAEGVALGYLSDVLTAMSLECRRERFPVPFVAGEVASRIAFAVSAMLIVAGVWIGASRPLAVATCWAAAGILAQAPWHVAGLIGRRWPTRTFSENLIGALSQDDPEACPARVVFMAHHDTKSQSLPTGVRVAAVGVVSAACGALFLCGMIAAAGASGAVSGEIPLSIAAVALTGLALLACNSTGNRSPGALDNGSGLGTLLELARTWRPRPGAPVEAFWVATGAEELGLVGARDLLRRHERWWRQKPTLLINLDSVGAGKRIYLAGERTALSLASETADRLGLDWSRLRYVGAGMDHEPFAARGLTAVSLLGDVVSASLSMHSSRDTLEVVDDSALDRAGRLASELAWGWAERHRADRPIMTSCPSCVVPEGATLP